MVEQEISNLFVGVRFPLPAHMASGDSFKKAHDPVLPDEKEKELEEAVAEDSAELGASATEPAADDDVDKAYEKVFGNKPRGKTLAEEIEEDEKSR